MKNRGFSLLELMIVVAIIMIMAGFGMWGLGNRFYKNEILRMKTAIPTLLNNATLKVYERGISGASVNIGSNRISFTGAGLGSYVYNANASKFSFSSSPSSISINNMGTFTQDFEIIVYDAGTSNAALSFSIDTKENLGVYSLSVTQRAF